MFNKMIKTDKIPANAIKFPNGDYLISATYEDAKAKNKPMFYYYKPTPKGIKQVRSFWKKQKALQYQWLVVNDKIDPNYGKAVTKKKAPKKKAIKKKAIKKKAVAAKTERPALSDKPRTIQLGYGTAIVEKAKKKLVDPTVIERSNVLDLKWT